MSLVLHACTGSHVKGSVRTCGMPFMQALILQIWPMLESVHAFAQILANNQAGLPQRWSS